MTAARGDQDIRPVIMIGFGVVASVFLALLIFTGSAWWLLPLAIFENALLAQAYCRHPYSLNEAEIFAVAYFSLAPTDAQGVGS